jgi:hypothetical protein
MVAVIKDVGVVSPPFCNLKIYYLAKTKAGPRCEPKKPKIMTLKTSSLAVF